MNVAANARLRLAKKARLRWDARHQKTMLLYPERGLLLNAVGTALLKLCDGQRDWEHVMDELGNAFPDVEKDTLDKDANEFIAKLSLRGLIEGL